MSAPTTGASTPILSIHGLKTYFATRVGDVRAVDGVDLTIATGQTVGLVGESGSGKSVTARSIMRLVPTPPGRNAGGTILFKGSDLLALSDAEMNELRGGEISMIFQDPMTFLNPVYTAGEQVAEAIRRHQGKSRKEARAQTIELFRTVGIPDPDERYDAYPHQLSGGMRQ
ncbi:MAG TPA: ABC transporter ATP-binding protein, partial [Thermomicrobiales bacterium]|nr:ABC transporter ATP-binding protein [Thermomicrobiales bacterium]